MGLLPMDVDILPPSDDRLFKLILSSPDGKPVLMDLISALINRPVVDVVVRNNELPLEDTEEKAERLDVNCRINDGAQVDLEMQASRIKELSGGHKNLKGKSVYYVCDLHSSQPAKGRRYDNLVQTYQVTFCAYTVFPELPDYVNPFSILHDITGELLSDAIHVIYVELTKLSAILQKPVSDMTDLEKYALFFQYADDPKYRGTVNKVIESKEALQLAGDLIMSVSQNERERAIFRSRRMFQTDLDSNLATAEAIGEARGEAKSRAEGRAEQAIEIARSLLDLGDPVDKIIQVTGLTREEVENLK